jgi:hypothetical protein
MMGRVKGTNDAVSAVQINNTKQRLVVHGKTGMTKWLRFGVFAL